MKILVTGGAGFIGANFVRWLLGARPRARVTVLDRLTYAGNLENLHGLLDDCRCRLVRGDIADAAAVRALLAEGFDAAVNFAAETHVDRSIEDAAPFLHTNVLGAHTLLEAARRSRLPLLVHISTDEVYGPAPPGECFDESAALRPSSPYAASKAAADLLLRASQATYGQRAILLRLSNNYGPFQFPEKLIPLAIACAQEGKPVPIYGDGRQERDWLFVEDACRGVLAAIEHGRAGGIYNLGAGRPRTNLAVVRAILRLLGREESLVRFVEDRPGHDRRYALSCERARRELRWAPQVSFEDGLAATVAWYQQNTGWLERARSGEYRRYFQRHYARRAESLRAWRAEAATPSTPAHRQADVD
jgi:dTDP-glucose 4,6-dehydratase